jgi:hypothetical protein
MPEPGPCLGYWLPESHRFGGDVLPRPNIIAWNEDTLNAAYTKASSSDCISQFSFRVQREAQPAYPQVRFDGCHWKLGQEKGHTYPDQHEQEREARLSRLKPRTLTYLRFQDVCENGKIAKLVRFQPSICGNGLRHERVAPPRKQITEPLPFFSAGWSDIFQRCMSIGWCLRH